MKKILHEYWSDPFKKYTTLILIILGFIALFISQLPSDVVGDEDLIFFYHPSCPHCTDQKPFLDQLEARYDVKFSRFDVSTSYGKEQFLFYTQKHNLEQKVPLTIFGDDFVQGFDTVTTTGVLIESKLQSHLGLTDDVNQSSDFSQSQLQSTTSLDGLSAKISWLGDLKQYSLLTLAIILGLLDGFNPCAMWVLIVLISLVAQLNDKRRIWLIVGSFLLASGVLYFLFMTAWLNAFLFIGAVRPVMILIGLIAIGSGIFSIRAFVTKEDMTCKVGDAKEKAATVSKMQEIINAPLSIATIFGIIVLAFVVNSIEFACSAAIPAVFTQTLVLSDVSGFMYYWYILVYVFFFMLDDLIIFSIAIFALSHISQDKYLRFSTIVGGIILLLLGVLLVFFPNLLSSLF
jgi:thiol-disulfide isomerase/thioredoxin